MTSTPHSFSFFDRAQRMPLRTSARVMVVVDFINPIRFPGAENLVKSAYLAARATLALKRRLAKNGVAVIYANDNYGIWRSEFRGLLKECKALPGLRGEIATMLAPDEDDLTILKPLHSAFLGTPLDHLLKEMKAKELILVGLSADICVHLTAMDAYMRGYKLWVPADCIAAESSESKAAALRHMSTVLKCSVRKSTGRIERR